jgi:hypothetical protein
LSESGFRRIHQIVAVTVVIAIIGLALRRK